MGFVAFWFDVFRDSTAAIIACFGLAGDAAAAYRFAAKHPDKPRPPWLVWLFSERQCHVRKWILIAIIASSLMWTIYDKWAAADQARIRQQFPRFPIGFATPSSYRVLESTEWVELGTPSVPYDWSTLPPDADVFATIRVRMSTRRGNCRAARVRVRDLGADIVAGESERIAYIPNGNQVSVVRIRLDRRTRLVNYILEVASETTECRLNVRGEIGAEYR